MILIGIILSFAGCTTIAHGVQISNVPNVSEVNIRNAGTTHWGTNLAANLTNIDRSRFSEQVDIRVVDTTGAVFSRYNVPFGDAEFVETYRRHFFGAGTNTAGGIITLTTLIVLAIAFGGGE